MTADNMCVSDSYEELKDSIDMGFYCVFDSFESWFDAVQRLVKDGYMPSEWGENVLRALECNTIQKFYPRYRQLRVIRIGRDTYNPFVDVDANDVVYPRCLLFLERWEERISKHFTHIANSYNATINTGDLLSAIFDD